MIVNDIIEAFKELRDLAIGMRNQPLMDKLLLIQGEISRLVEENFSIQSRLHELETELRKNDSVLFNQKGYFEFVDKHIGIKFCSRCYSTKNNSVPLMDGDDGWICPECRMECTKK